MFLRHHGSHGIAWNDAAFACCGKRRVFSMYSAKDEDLGHILSSLQRSNLLPLLRDADKTKGRPGEVPDSANRAFPALPEAEFTAMIAKF